MVVVGSAGVVDGGITPGTATRGVGAAGWVAVTIVIDTAGGAVVVGAPPVVAVAGTGSVAGGGIGSPDVLAEAATDTAGRSACMRRVATTGAAQCLESGPARLTPTAWMTGAGSLRGS